MLVKGNMGNSLIRSFGRVDPQVDLSLKTSVSRITPSLEQNIADRWMVADLLSVDKTSINKTLKSLSQNRIKRFIHLYICIGASQSKSYHILESVLRS